VQLHVKQLKFTDTIFFFGTLSILLFFKEARPAPFPFSGKEAPNVVHPFNQTTLSHWGAQKQ
jgi:hypothetical protein